MSEAQKAPEPIKKNVLGDLPVPADLVPASHFMSIAPSKSLSIDQKDIPVEATLESLPRKPYWAGVTSDAPFHSVQIAHTTLQRVSYNLVNGQPANPKLGMLVKLDETQLKKIIEESKKVAWRKREIKKKVGKEIRTETVYDRIDLRSVNEVLLRGDKLTAHYIYIAPMEAGQRIPVGVMDEEGRPLPTPAPLIKVA
jgi:hypothetical protein